jgi:hypothetical protein
MPFLWLVLGWFIFWEVMDHELGFCSAPPGVASRTRRFEGPQLPAFFRPWDQKPTEHV